MSKSQWICPNCKGSDVYEDDSGFFWCSICNLQSQEHFAESFEMEDIGDANIARSGRGIYTVRQSANGNMKMNKKGKEKKRSKQNEPQVEHYLEAYQYVLRLVTKMVVDLTKSTELEGNVRNLWIKYLEKWRDSEYPIRNSFHREISNVYTEKYFASDTLPYPPLPTKQLIYGLVALALRLEGSWAVPCDLVRWCAQGKLPFSNLKELLPSYIKEKIGTIYNRPFMNDFQHGNFLSPTNVFFHTYLLAESLNIVIPLLNVPLVARAMFASLKLPASCWTAFCSVSQMFRSTIPLHTMDMMNVHHAEYIMAMCIAAIKFQENWAAWDYHIDEDGDVYMPAHIGELDNVRRDRLEEYLARVRVTLRDSSADTVHKRSYNNSVRTALQATEDLWADICPVEDSVKASSPLLSSSYWGEEASTLSDQGYLRWLRLYNIRPRKAPNAHFFGAYMSYADWYEDKNGLLLPAYVVLVERCAKHLHTTPGLLHLLVDRIDKEIETILNENKKAALYAEVHHRIDAHEAYSLRQKMNRGGRRKRKAKKDLLAMLNLRSGRLSSDNTHSWLGGYKRYSKTTLPVLRKLGASSLYASSNEELNKQGKLMSCDDADDGADAGSVSDSDQCLLDAPVLPTPSVPEPTSREGIYFRLSENKTDYSCPSITNQRRMFNGDEVLKTYKLAPSIQPADTQTVEEGTGESYRGTTGGVWDEWLDAEMTDDKGRVFRFGSKAGGDGDGSYDEAEKEEDEGLFVQDKTEHEPEDDYYDHDPDAASSYEEDDDDDDSDSDHDED